MKVERLDKRTHTPTITRRSFNKAVAATAVMTAASASKVLGANERIHVGVIGCGGRSYAHIDTILKLKESGANVDITAVCDVYRPRMKKAMERTGGRGTMRHEELLAWDNSRLLRLDKVIDSASKKLGFNR